MTQEKLIDVTAHIANKSGDYIMEIDEMMKAKEGDNSTQNMYGSKKRRKFVSYPSFLKANMNKGKKGLTSQNRTEEVEDMEVKPEIKRLDAKLGMLVNDEEQVPKEVSIEFKVIEAKSGIPRLLMNGKFMLRILWNSYDYLTLDEDNSNIMIVGGVLDVTVYKPLPEPKFAKNWKIQAYNEGDQSLDVIQFPKPDAEGKIVVTKQSNKILIAFKLPETVYIAPNDIPQVVQYVPETGRWSSEFASNVQIKNKTLELFTKRLCPVSFYQPKTVDFPYVSWKLRAISEDLALLDLETKRIQLKFKIGPGFVILCKRSDPELQHLIEREMQPLELLYELYRCGINLLPEDRDYVHCMKVLKDPEAEDKAIDDICSAINAYYFQGTKWNASSPKGMIHHLLLSLYYHTNLSQNL